MADVSPNLKVNISADTSQFDRGMKAAKAEMRDFGKTSDDVLGRLGEAAGLDMQEIDKLSNAIRGLGLKLSEAGSEGAQAFGKLLSSVSKFTVGVAGLGIAGIVAGFKALNAEAENFKSTVAGANIELQTAAYIETFRQAMHDMNADTGKAVAEAQSQWQKWWATLPTRLAARTAVTPGMTPTSPMMGVTQDQLQLSKQINDAFDDAVNRAEIAADATGEIYQLERQRKEQAVEIAKINRDISYQMGEARDATNTVADRQAAIAKIEELLAQKKKMTVDLETRLAELYELRSDQAGDFVKDADEVLAQQQRAFDVETQIKNEENSLLKIKKSLNAENAKANAALREQLELQRQIAQSRADLRALDLGVGGISGPGASLMNPIGLTRQIDLTEWQSQINMQLGGVLFAQVELRIDKSSLVDISNQVQSVVSNLAANLGESIGGLVGDLLTGGDAWANFSNAALQAFGNMATSVGRIAIECGVAALGIKATLESLGPAGALTAIAAGTALVALGAAVRAGLSNVASGSYSSTANVASGYSAGAGDYTTRDVNVHVTGKLEADGDSLVAVINNTNNRNGYTT